MGNEKHLQDLKEIRQLMEKSTRFLSLSGWSGIMAGIYSLIGAYAVHQHITYSSSIRETTIALIGLAVMAAALITGGILTQLKAKKAGQTLFGKSALRMVAHIGFPMAVGFMVWLALAIRGDADYMAGMLLIFYGLGLVNGSKYTVNDIRILGVANVMLGIVALFWLTYGLYLWAAGFGLGHIIYGVYMWVRYERK